MAVGHGNSRGIGRSSLPLKVAPRSPFPDGNARTAMLWPLARRQGAALTSARIEREASPAPKGPTIIGVTRNMKHRMAVFFMTMASFPAYAGTCRVQLTHSAIASLESAFEVVVITQNVDELHERAGSGNEIHLQGQLAYSRGTSDSPKRYRIEDSPISLAQLCEHGTQLRPDIVWFGERNAAHG